MKPAKLIIACCNAGKAKKAVDEIKTATGFQDIEPWDLDLASFASVCAFARRFDESGLQLHVLLNNAAVASPPYFRTNDGFETTWVWMTIVVVFAILVGSCTEPVSLCLRDINCKEGGEQSPPPPSLTRYSLFRSLQVNHLSTMFLTLLLLPVIRRTAASLTWAPRIILLTSEVHYWADLPERMAPNILTALNNSTAWDSANRYRVTKLFNVLFVQELARRLARSPLLGDRSIVVSSVNSGLTNTDIGVGSLSFTMRKLLFGRSAERSAITSVYVATAPEVAKLTPYGRYYSNCIAEKAANLTLGVEGEELAGRLWRESLEVIGGTDARINRQFRLSRVEIECEDTRSRDEDRRTWRSSVMMGWTGLARMCNDIVENEQDLEIRVGWHGYSIVVRGGGIVQQDPTPENCGICMAVWGT
ncbi:hypothetical protein BC936DRAFT_140068 [Jimgerdemannia flammicorona]|uniref:Uncharacterized protein n=1 Tax=Jimgerdemannia flammicorona TaxID=994334 RepID=A0A433B330_9FUNG|nr:hypothetical protein BC936DRAFT_140068 [Jimgerdemannia flammicorona]